MKPADGSAGCAVDSVQMDDPYAPILTGEKQARSIGSHGARADRGGARGGDRRRSGKQLDFGDQAAKLR